MHFDAKISQKSGWIRARGVNMHAGGATVVARRPLTPHSVVIMRLKSFKLMGLAQVKHCTERGLWSYTIGVAFHAPLMSEELGFWQFQQIRQTDCKTPRSLEPADPAEGV